MDDLIEQQQRRIYELEFRVRELEEALMPSTVEIPLEWGLPRCEARIFAMLTTRDVLTKQALHLALYGDRLDGHDYPPELVESHMSKLRKRVARFGVKITGKRFEGYRLHDRHRFIGKVDSCAS